MRMTLLNIPAATCLAMGLLVLITISAASCVSPGEGRPLPAAGPVALVPPPPVTDIERQWSRAWIDAAAGISKTEQVEVECVSQGWGALHRGENMEGQPLCLGGKKYADGLATHANSDIRVRAAHGFKRLRVLAGVDDNTATNSVGAVKVGFSIQVADKTIWSCDPRGAGNGAAEVDVDLAGATEFHLLARCGKTNTFAHADWVQPVATLSDGTTVDLSRPAPGLGTPILPPFSFRYDGKLSSELLPTWPVTRTTLTEAGGVTLHRSVYKDPKTALECVMDLREYADFPAAKWVVHFRNGGQADTPILEDIQALDTSWHTSSKSSLVFAKGSDSAADDFQNTTAPFLPNEPKTLKFGCQGGRPSTLFLPYFNLRDSRMGVMIGIGWSGEWVASFEPKRSAETRVRAGMKETNLVLHKGEEIRTPSILTVFWQGDAMRGHNLLRQFILNHNSPRKDGRIVQAPLALSTWGGQLSNVQIEEIKRAHEAGMPADIFWIDAGWFGDAKGQFLPESTGHWARQVGNWNIDRSIHPDGLVEVRKAARAAGMGMLLWVEPERAMPGTQMTVEHPDWYLGDSKGTRSVLLNLGNPQARQWATDLISGLIKDLDLTWYRQDFNMECLAQWKANDTPDRLGMTEIRYVEGLYAFWDDLLKRHPGLMIDNCASGGRRLDFELLSRSTPLWRTDYHNPPGEPDFIGAQLHTMGLSYWLPLSGTAAYAEPLDTYVFRSNLTAAMAYATPLDVLTNAPVRDWLRTMLMQHNQARPFFYGDYYPLTTNSSLRDAWAAYQMHRRDTEQGMLVMLRRTESPFASAQFKLRGLDAAGAYEFTDADTGKKITCSGKEAMDGLTWTIDKPRSSRLIFYRKVK